MTKISDIIASTKAEPNPNSPQCKGLLFKVTENHYFDGNAIHENRTIRLLKRKSCKCPRCDYVLKEVLPDLINNLYDFDGNDLVRDKIYELRYDLEEDGEGSFHFQPLSHRHCKHGAECLIEYPFVHNGGPSCPCVKLELK